MWDTLCAPGPEQAAAYYDAGWWRTGTLLDDLERHALATPDRAAIIAYESGAHARTLSYRELAAVVERFAGALVRLGVSSGDVVVLYLPNRWMLTPLYLACARIGALASPVIPVLGGRELAHVLSASRAKVCITVDRFNDIDYRARLAGVAPDTLAHQVVIGEANDEAASFAELFDAEPGDTGDWPAPVGPDDPALLLYTSGTGGHMKGVVHSHNTVYAAARAVSEPHGLTGDDVVSIPNFMTHMAGATYAGFMPLLLGATCVMQDTNTDMALLLDLVERHGITWAYASPSYLHSLLDAERDMPRKTGSLRRIVSGSAPVQPDLIAQVRDVFDVPLHTLWGMTENGAVTVTRPEDPEGWGARSDGRPMPWMQLRIEVADAGSSDDPNRETDVFAEAGAGRLLVRGASQCLGYLDERELYEACVDADGWFDTGDLARDDGRGGIRITGRRSDLITRASGQKVSTLEVETALLRHPSVTDVALVGYPDPDVPGTDLVCAVVVPAGGAPTLQELHDYLQGEQMAPVLWPDRVQFVWELPKNAIGKVLRQPLRQRLELAQLARK